MRDARSWIIPVTALSLCACSQSQVPTASTGSGTQTSTSSGSNQASVGSFNPATLDSAFQPALVGSVQSAVNALKSSNSTSNFTMPIGNNFTMPIGNNFTMPIGNNFTMPIGNNLANASAYQVASLVLGSQLPFGFIPLPKGTTVATTSAVAATLTGTGISGTLSMSPWTDPSNSSDPGYDEDLHYSSLAVPLGATTATLSGDYWLKESATAFTLDPSVDLGGAEVLGVNYVPASPTGSPLAATLATREHGATLTAGNGGTVNFTISESGFKVFQIPFLGSSAPAVQVPSQATIDGSLDAGNGPGLTFALGASASVPNLAFYIDGTLTPNGVTTPIQEHYTMDLKAATSQLVYEQPAGSQAYGWRMTLNYNYMVALSGAGDPVTGDLWLIDSNGDDVSGGKLADIVGDASGNPVLKYEDGTSSTWQMPTN